MKDNRNRLWLLEFQTAAPLNLPEKWQWSLIIGFSSSSSKNSFSQVTCFGVLEIRGIFTCRDNPDGYGYGDSYTFPKMNDELFCKILIFSPFVSRDWLHIKLVFRSLACKEEAISWRPVFLIFICNSFLVFFSQVSIPSVENSKSA